MKILPFLLIVFPSFVLAQPQELNLKLHFHDGNGPFEYENFPVKWNDTTIAFKNTYTEIRGIPGNLKNIKRGIICFDFIQYVYQNFNDGKISKENFSTLKNILGTHYNEKLLVKNKIRCYVNLVSATNEKNEIVCMIDTNNDDDFNDEIPFEPVDDMLPDSLLNKQLREVRCERLLNGKVIEDRVPILIAKRNSYIVFGVAQYAIVNLQINGKKSKLAVCPTYFHSRSWIETQMVLLNDSSNENLDSQNLIVNKGGFISIDNNIYQFIGVDITKDLVTLRKMNGKDQFSSQVGFHAPLFKATNLSTGKEVSLTSEKGKYILIDFWGTWCAPCREQIPDLVALNRSIDTTRFALISIASSDNVDSVRKVTARENMSWPQILSDKITRQYSVSAFPTSVLIDPNGIVIANGITMDDLKQKLSALSLLN